jgi:predicted nucleotidyltransferase
MLGGSHAYGLNTPASDIDYRGVYCYDDPHYILGLKKDDVFDSREAGKDDEVYYELRKYLNLLRKTNTMAMELLFNHSWIVIDSAFEQIQKKRESLIDSNYFYKSLVSYVTSETRLAFGERTGNLGGKRKAALDTFGYSPRNVLHILRLTRAGEIFFQRGIFPVNIALHSPPHAEQMMDIKLHPEKYQGKLSELRSIISQRMHALEESYLTRKFHYEYDDKVANDICVSIYKSML